MKILIAGVEYSDTCRDLSSDMEESLTKGDFHRLKCLAEKLKALGDKQCRIELQVKTWETLLAEIRRFIPGFSADYVIPAISVKKIAQLPLDVPEEVKQLLAYSSTNGLGVIQLPEDDE